MGDAPRPDDMTPIQQAQAYAEGRSDDISRELVTELLASHLAMQQAGEEMPSVDALCILAAGGDGSDQTPEQRRAIRGQMALAQRLIRPAFARLTQERDTYAEGSRKGAELAAMLNTYGLPAEPKALARRLEERGADMAALRQRAERAERALEDVSARLVERDGMLDRAIGQAEQFAAEAKTLTARIVELEASREPGADVVDGVALAMLRSLFGGGTTLQEHEAGPWREQARAAITHLAAMGEEAWQGLTLEDVLGDCRANNCLVSRDEARVVLGVVRSRLSPVLGALRARVAKLEEHAIRRVEEEREACCDVARDVYQGNTEIPRKDAPAWYACAEFIAGEIARRT